MKAKARWLCLVFAALLAAGAHAQSYPVKPVRLVVANAPGGSDDQHGRMLAQKLTESFGQQFIVDNRAGTGGLIARTFVAKSAADGYTLLLGAASMAISQHLAAKPLGDPVRDYAPISLVAKTHSVLLVHPSIPAKTVKEFIALARTRGNTLNYGPIISALPHIASGKVRALAVSGTTRAAKLPQVPTVAEAALPDYEMSGWYGVFAPAGTPSEIITSLNAVLVKQLASHCANR